MWKLWNIVLSTIFTFSYETEGRRGFALVDIRPCKQVNVGTRDRGIMNSRAPLLLQISLGETLFAFPLPIVPSFPGHSLLDAIAMRNPGWRPAISLDPRRSNSRSAVLDETHREFGIARVSLNDTSNMQQANSGVQVWRQLWTWWFKTKNGDQSNHASPTSAIAVHAFNRVQTKRTQLHVGFRRS